MDDKKKNGRPDVVAATRMIGHLVIRDKNTKEILVNQSDVLKGSLGKNDKR